MMSEKRFRTNGYYINDTFYDGRKWLVNEVEAKEIVDEMNNLDTKARERSKALSKLQKKHDEQQATINNLKKENDLLRAENRMMKINISKLLYDNGNGGWHRIRDL